MKKSQITSKIRTALIGKLLDKKRNKIARRIKSFKLGFRYRMITDNDEQILGNLIKEVLQHCKDPAVAKAFLEGESHARKEKSLIGKSIEQQTKQMERGEQMTELQKVDQKQPKVLRIIADEKNMTEEEFRVQIEATLGKELKKLDKIREQNKDKSKDKSR